MADALDDVIWEIEDPDEVLSRAGIRALPAERLALAVHEAECVRMGRSIERATHALPDREARRFAAACVADLLPQWSARYPDDARPLRALDLVRRMAAGEVEDDERLPIERAARAAGDAAYADCFPDGAPPPIPPGVSFPAIAYAASCACARPLRATTVARYASVADDSERRARLERQLAWLEANTPPTDPQR